MYICVKCKIVQKQEAKFVLVPNKITLLQFVSLLKHSGRFYGKSSAKKLHDVEVLLFLI